MGSAPVVTSGNNIQTYSSISRKLKVLDVGGNDGLVAKKLYPDSELTIVDTKNGWDVMKSGLPSFKNWDIILANHFIEHISDIDYFLDECKMVMNPNTILNIGTPNLTAWFNRILFLFGYVPHSVELSNRYNVGKPFNWNKEELGGHLRIYTIPSLVQLLKYHGFKILKVTGEYSTYPTNLIISQLDKFITDININFASAFRVLCTIQPK